MRDPVSGQIRCRSSDPACVPLNLFGNAASSAARDYVTAIARTETEIDQHLVSVNATGTAFTIPGGEVRIAVGADYRRESSEFRPDALSASGRARGAPLTAIGGSFNANELHAEALVPLIGAEQGFAFAHTLQLEGAVRWVDHSSAGSDTTWTAGLRFAPVQSVKLRGNYTESIRAPAITEVFLPTSQIGTQAQDPCDARFIGLGIAPARRAANCAAAGVRPAFQSTISGATQLVTLEGNRNLKNEKAEAWTAGVVFTPSFLRNFTLAVDWIDIELEDAIEQLSATVILQGCYDSADFPNAAVCQRFGRDAGSQVVNMRTGFLNAGLVNFAGLTADLKYEVSLGNFGNLSFGVNYFRLDELDFQ
ncbi:MAG: TonB-dependent receptor [Gammaproteobacteria bacterium]|nr:TonB-dependent receptor [Gammaproteobacteria bacterium]